MYFVFNALKKYVVMFNSYANKLNILKPKKSVTVTTFRLNSLSNQIMWIFQIDYLVQNQTFSHIFGSIQKMIKNLC